MGAEESQKGNHGPDRRGWQLGMAVVVDTRVAGVPGSLIVDGVLSGGSVFGCRGRHDGVTTCLGISVRRRHAIDGDHGHQPKEHRPRGRGLRSSVRMGRMRRSLLRAGFVRLGVHFGVVVR